MELCLITVATAMLTGCGGGSASAVDPEAAGSDTISMLRGGAHAFPLGSRKIKDPHMRDGGASLPRQTGTEPIVVDPMDTSLSMPTTEVVSQPVAPVPPTTITASTLAVTVDTTSLPVPQPGVSAPMLSAPGSIPPLPAASDWEQEGAFRLLCNWSKMGFDDPIVYPGQPGAAHHHTFFGNTAVDAFTTTDNIRSKGNATCRGGTINLSAYWVPSMIDTATGKPLAPLSLLIYYKTGLWPYMNDNSVMRPLPPGLKMITGDPSRSSPGQGQYECFVPQVGQTRSGTKGASIPSCVAGEYVRTHIAFPQCWDGVNLDSPDHKSHMAFPENFWSGNPLKQYRCPLSHPVVLPLITFMVDYPVTVGAVTSKWRLSSDAYDSSKPGGYSLHADWMNGWDPVVSDLWGVKCMRERRNCGSANLGDGRNTLEFQGN